MPFGSREKQPGGGALNLLIFFLVGGVEKKNEDKGEVWREASSIFLSLKIRTKIMNEQGQTKESEGDPFMNFTSFTMPTKGAFKKMTRKGGERIRLSEGLLYMSEKDVLHVHFW